MSCRNLVVDSVYNGKADIVMTSPDEAVRASPCGKHVPVDIVLSWGRTVCSSKSPLLA